MGTEVLPQGLKGVQTAALMQQVADEFSNRFGIVRMHASTFYNHLTFVVKGEDEPIRLHVRPGDCSDHRNESTMGDCLSCSGPRASLKNTAATNPPWLFCAPCTTFLNWALAKLKDRCIRAHTLHQEIKEGLTTIQLNRDRQDFVDHFWKRKF